MADVVDLQIVAGIARMTVNNPPVNTITAQVRDGLNQCLDQLEKSQNVQALILSCEGKTFFSGADIGEFNGPPKEAEYRSLFSRFEKLPIPVIAAMHGTVMGGGLEIALACHYRIAAAGTRFAFPEVTLGIIPGAGGTQRMPRLIGIEATLDMVVNAAPVQAEEAKESGFIDVIAEESLQETANTYAQKLIGENMPPRPTAAMSVRPVKESVINKFQQLAQNKYPHRTAALTAIDVISKSAELEFSKGLDYETEKVNRAKQTQECKGAIHTFFAERATTKLPEISDSITPLEIKKVAIIGAGTMGTGIAMCFANAGIPATLIDINEQSLQHGMQNIDANYERRVNRGRMSAEKKAKTMALIAGSTTMNSVADANLVIEAVFEDMKLKQSIFKSLDEITLPDTILATNTSTLDINKIGAVISRPENVIGLHFFSPANVMPLLEVVHTDSTSQETIRTAMDLAKKIRKTPVLAKVCYGFIGNRMMEGYAREAEFMALEGATPRKIDDTLQGFGMAMGILAVFDMAGVDVGVKVHKANAEQFPPDPAYYQASQAMYDAGRMGQKNGKGFYQYKPGDRHRYDDEEALRLLEERGKELGIQQRNDHTEQEIIERCLFPLINEAIQILDEGVALRASDIDVVWTSGYGFPRFRGGPLYYADTIGLKTVYDGILTYQKKFGSVHWQPAPLLKKLVAEGKSIADWEASQKR